MILLINCDKSVDILNKPIEGAIIRKLGNITKSGYGPERIYKWIGFTNDHTIGIALEQKRKKK